MRFDFVGAKVQTIIRLLKKNADKNKNRTPG